MSACYADTIEQGLECESGEKGATGLGTEGRERDCTVGLKLEAQQITHHECCSQMSLPNPRVPLSVHHQDDPSKHDINRSSEQCGRDEYEDCLDYVRPKN